MATITLKNVPDNVHLALKAQAKRHKRSLNQEALFCLDQVLSRKTKGPETLLEEIRDLRSRVSLKMKAVDLDWIASSRKGRTAMIVADTSLLASLLLATPVTAAAETVLKKDSEWAAPPLWRYEFKNVLATQIRVLGLPLEHALALFEKAEELMIEPEVESDAKSILHLASERKLSAYDAECLSLAYSLGIRLITFDRGLLKAAPDVAVSPEAFGGS